MDSVPACGPGPGAPSSSVVASRAGGSSLPDHQRSFVSLRPAARFAAILRNGEARRSGGITVIRTQAEIGPPQVGIVASRHVGNAVLRNRAKRRLREALMRVELRPDMAYVVVASPEVVTMEFDELTRRLSKAVTPREPEEQ